MPFNALTDRAIPSWQSLFGQTRADLAFSTALSRNHTAASPLTLPRVPLAAAMTSLDSHAPCCLHQRTSPASGLVRALKQTRSCTRKLVNASTPHPGHRKRRCRRAKLLSRALADDARDEPVDIDQLAKRLSQEAERVRQQDLDWLDQPSVSASGDDFAASFAEAVRSTEDRGQATAESASPFGFEVNSN